MKNKGECIYIYDTLKTKVKTKLKIIKMDNGHLLFVFKLNDVNADNIIEVPFTFKVKCPMINHFADIHEAEDCRATWTH